MIKVFRMNDCDWVAAETSEDAVVYYLDMISAKNTPEDRFEYLEEPIEALGDDDMKKLQFHDPEAGTKHSFADQLEAEKEAGRKFPSFFASTEY